MKIIAKGLEPVQTVVAQPLPFIVYLSTERVGLGNLATSSNLVHISPPNPFLDEAHDVIEARPGTKDASHAQGLQPFDIPRGHIPANDNQ